MIVHVPERLAEIRRRLSSPSWMMRFLTEKVARMANAEDQVSGRFWQGRFSMVRLLDEAAIAACLVYVDLNPIRAGIAQTPEESRFTSVYERIRAAVAVCTRQTAETTAEESSSGFSIAAGLNAATSTIESDPSRIPEIASSNGPRVPEIESATSRQRGEQPTSGERAPAIAAWLAPLEISADFEKQPVPGTRASNRGCLEMSFAAYLELLEWSGRQWRSDKRCAIPENLPAVFERLSIPADGWLELLKGFQSRFRRVAGSPAAMAREAERRGKRYLHGMPASRTAYGAGLGYSPGTGTDPAVSAGKS
jgi:hypothetical protein